MAFRSWVCRGLVPLLALGVLNLIQVSAWVQMFASDLTRYEASEALSRTFDGAHPCALCEAVTAARDRDLDRPAPIRRDGAAAPVALLPTAIALVPAPLPFTQRRSWCDPAAVLATVAAPEPRPPIRG